MKAQAILIATLGLAAGALGVTVTFFSDKACATKAGNLLQGASNPTAVVSLSLCWDVSNSRLANG